MTTFPLHLNIYKYFNSIFLMEYNYSNIYCENTMDDNSLSGLTTEIFVATPIQTLITDYKNNITYTYHF